MASPRQNGEILGMTGRGAKNDPQRVDGSTLEPGIHLRWQMNPDLGFPAGGFDLYRRNENHRKHLRCGSFFETDNRDIRWLPYTDNQPDKTSLTISSTGDSHVASACQPIEQLSAVFPGEQEVRIDFSIPVRHVRLLFDKQTVANPVAEAYWESSSGDVLVASKRARVLGNYRYINLFGDRIDYIKLIGEDMVLCVLCFVGILDGKEKGWDKTPLNGKTPIYLPVTHPEWHAPHPNSPDDHAEAASRLPANLPTEKRKAYEEGFNDELHPLLCDLVKTEEHRLFRIKESDADSDTTLDWPGMTLLQLMAVDPNIARILGLYWHDTPPSLNTFYDYRVVAHYENKLLPGKLIHYNHLDPNVSYGTVLNDQNIFYSCPNSMEVTESIWDGSEQTGLLFTKSILFAPISIMLPKTYASITLKLSVNVGCTVKSFRSAKYLQEINRVGGDHTLHLADSSGINVITIYPLGELTLFEMELRDAEDIIGDISYDVFHLKANSSPAVSIPAVEVPVVSPSTTGVDENGIFQQNQNRVGLRWDLRETSGSFLEAGAPVLFHVQRYELDESTEDVINTLLLNENAPTLVSTIDEPNYTDQHVPEGLYQYAVRGIDLFGVLGEWSDPERVDVKDSAAPPAPQGVEALYLDPVDPWLNQEDADWANDNGPGLKLSWVWPGAFRLQAPDVIPSDAEFRVYTALGPLNERRGHVLNTLDRGNKSALATDLDIPGNPDDLAGESIRVNNHFFTILTNTTGPNAVLEVKNLRRPALAPTTGPCTITLTQTQNIVDYGETTNWQHRQHIEPVQDLPLVTGSVVSVASQTDDELEKLGASRIVTINQLMPDDEGLAIPGSLMCNGVLYRVFEHTQDTALHLHIAPVISPTDYTELIEPAAGDSCEYYPGWRYEIRIPGFNLSVPAGEASTMAHVAVSCSDGKPHVNDASEWDQPGRGGLGGRPGNEGALSRLARVTAYQRTIPATVGNVPVAPPDPIFAEPANYYGMARYALTWDAVSGVHGYTVYRCSGEGLFEFDRIQREQQNGAYETGSVFVDDPGFSAWVSEFDPTLTEADMIADPIAHATAWRTWASRFYGTLNDQDVQGLANKVGNEGAFRGLNQEAITVTRIDDTFDGRGRGFYLYRVRTVDSAGNESTWSDTYPPVHIYDILPPAAPSITSITGGEQQITLNWAANRQSDLKEYLIWRSDARENLNDVRRTSPLAVIAANGSPDVSYIDSDILGRNTFYYGIAAVDQNGNRSNLSRIVSAQSIDTIPPEPPDWQRAEWINDVDGDGILLEWTALETPLTCKVERRLLGGGLWTHVSPWIETLAPSMDFEFIDRDVVPGTHYEYRIAAEDAAGNNNLTYNIQPVWSEEN